MLYPGGYGGFIGAQALVYQMLLHTRPSSIVEWPNKEGESRSFYDMCVKDVEDTRPHHGCPRSGDDQAAAPVMEEGRRSDESGGTDASTAEAAVGVPTSHGTDSSTLGDGACADAGASAYI